MKSTKYQLLKADFDHTCQQLRLYRETIEELRKENENLKRHKKVLMENSVVRSERIEELERLLEKERNAIEWLVKKVQRLEKGEEK